MFDLHVPTAAFPIVQIVRRRPSVRLQRCLGRTRDTRTSMDEGVTIGNAVPDLGLCCAIIIA